MHRSSRSDNALAEVVSLPPADARPVDTAADVYERLRALIVDGVLEPGSTVSQVKLAERLGVSRTPLREAIRRLQTERYIESEFNRRVRIAQLSPAGGEQTYAMRIALEPLAVRLSVPGLTDAELDRAAAELRAFEEASAAHDVHAARVPHRAFHALLVSHAGHVVVARLLELVDQAERFRIAYQRTSAGAAAAPDETAEEHAAILAAARARDGQQAMLLTARHLARVVLTTLAWIDPAYDPRTVRAALRMVTAGAGEDR